MIKILIVKFDQNLRPKPHEPRFSLAREASPKSVLVRCFDHFWPKMIKKRVFDFLPKTVKKSKLVPWGT